MFRQFDNRDIQTSSDRVCTVHFGTLDRQCRCMDVDAILLQSSTKVGSVEGTGSELAQEIMLNSFALVDQAATE